MEPAVAVDGLLTLLRLLLVTTGDELPAEEEDLEERLVLTWGVELPAAELLTLLRAVLVVLVERLLDSRVLL